MKLTIGTKSPDWWGLEDKRIKSIQEWWDGIEWRHYEPRREWGDSCNAWDVVEETVCLADIGVHSFAETFGFEWAYKIINHYIDIAQRGVISEYQNFTEMLQCFPCG